MSGIETLAETVALQSYALCTDCRRVFDLLDEEQSAEWYYGHDCEGE